MDTPTIKTWPVLDKTPRTNTYVQQPQNIQPVIDCFDYMHKNGWRPKKYNFYNLREKRHARAQEVYPKFRNSNP